MEDCNALVIKGLSHADTRPALKRHFDKFGFVTDVRLNLRLHQATVTFQDHDSAARAKLNGRVMNAATPRARNLIIFFKTPAKKPDSSTTTTTTTAKTMKTAMRPAGPGLSLDPGVNSELIAMGGGPAHESDSMTSLKASHGGGSDVFARRVSPEPY